MKRANGFSLIELMIVVAVIGILSAIAYPSYQESVRKGNRAEVKAALLEAAQALERFYSLNGSYLSAPDTLPNVYSANVPSAQDTKYQISVQGTPSRNTYTLRATRSGSMSGDPCGDFEISHTGQKAVVNATRTADECW